jgi:co-chaperonin GroES (HSP10)
MENFLLSLKTTRNNLLVEQIFEKNEIIDNINVSVNKDKDTDIGKVICISSGVNKEGIYRVNEKVCFGKFSGLKIKIKDKKFLLLSKNEILFKIKKDEHCIKVIESNDYNQLEKSQEYEINRKANKEEEFNI